jgi:Uma2 family endonuclease
MLLDTRRYREMAVEARRYTLGEFLALPEEKPALEFADGVITQKASPKTDHSAVQVDLVKRIDAAGMPAKRARSFSELRTTFGGRSRVPDVSVFRWARIPSDASGRLINDVTVPPDIAVEIVSPDQGVNSLIERCLWYVAHGVELALLVDPSDESVAAFRSGVTPEFWRGSERIDLGDVVPGFDLSVEQLFAALRVE